MKYAFSMGRRAFRTIAIASLAINLLIAFSVHVGVLKYDLNLTNRTAAEMERQAVATQAVGISKLISGMGK